MAYTAWSVVFGEQPTAAKWNQLGTNDASFNDGTGISSLEFGSGHTSLKNDYKFYAYRNSAWTVANGKVTFDTVVFDTGSNYSTSTGLFTAPVSGFYWFNTKLYFSLFGGGTDSGNVQLVYNNTTATNVGTYVSNSQGVGSSTGGPLIYQMSATDTMQVNMASVTRGDTGVTGSAATYFQGHLLSNT